MPEALALSTAPEPTIASRFREVAGAARDRIAIREGSRSITYGALDRSSDAVATALAARFGGAPRQVALLLPHDSSFVVAALAATKAGCIYVPLDPSWPAAHLDELLVDAEAAAVLTDRDGARLLDGRPSWRGEVMLLDEASLERGQNVELDVAPAATDPASIYYSSGSTGKPKGILLSHRSVLSEARNFAATIGIVPDDRVAWLSPGSFGASKLAIFGGLLSGACVLSFAVKQHGVSRLADWLSRERITVYTSVSSLFRELAGHLPDGENFRDLRAVKLGGEPVLSTDVDLFRRRIHRGCALWNGLGISEAGGNVCFHRWNGEALPDGSTLPLGRAIDGVEIAILDDSGRSVPPGGVGEIAVQASHLALGYWRRPDLTRAAFRTKNGDSRVYLTGDLGRLDAEGCLVGLGRKDSSLKIRGHKVNTTEVESALLSLGGIVDAAAIAKDVSGTTKLVAFVALSPGESFSAPDVRRKLRRRLPDYMIPSFLVALPSLPRLTSGKVDGHALRAMDLADGAGDRRVAPRDALERQIAHIWAKALRREEVGITDDFFDLGGDSLDAARIFAMMERWLHVNLPLTALAESPTIEALADVVRAQDRRAAQSSAVLLNAGESRVPFFCVPGAGSDAFALLDLARHLGPEQTFYALQHAGVDGSRPSFATVEQMAARFLADIRAIQPSGPYCLGGTSFGGIVAYEMARQLRATGEEVALLALIETYGPNYPRLRLGAALRHFPRVALRWLLPIGRKEERSLAMVSIGVRERWHRLQAIVDLWLPSRKAAPAYALRFAYLLEVCLRAHRLYRFPPYDGAALLYTTERQLPAELFALSDDMGWRPRVRGGLEIEQIPGYHGAHIREPHVGGLAAKLRTRLAGVARRADGDFTELTSRSRELWNQLGSWWDEQIGESGNAQFRDVLAPAVDRLLAVRPGERVLDVACGNGWYGRRLARAGASVVGFDFSEVLVDRARARAAATDLDVAYHVLDATDAAALGSLGERSFDAAVCLMGLMDMTTVEPLFGALSRLLKPGGRFVFSMIHPETEGLTGTSPGQPLTNIGIDGQPVAHYYFHRPLAMLFELAAEAGLTLVANEEPRGRKPGASEEMSFFVGRLAVSG